MISINEGKTRRNIDIPCQVCGHPTSYQLSFAHNENPNAKTNLFLCDFCLSGLNRLTEKVLKNSITVNRKAILSEETQIRLWKEFSDYDIDENECITKQFLHFPAGTHREEIWHWMEDHGPLSAHQLLYEIE